MPSLPFGMSSYERGPGDLPELPSINLYAEEAPTEEKGIVLQSRPGLVDRDAGMADGPIEALFRRDLVLDGNLFGISDGALYSGSAYVGAVGGGTGRIAGNEIGLMVTTGGPLYFYDGSTLAAVSFPDSASVVDVFTGGSRFWAIRKDTGKLYWTDALEGDIESLDFATAESLPDRLLQGLWIDGVAVLFGKESVEFWAQTGSSTLPLQPIQNRVIEKGLRATGCAVGVGPTFAWVTNTNQVCLSDENTVISNPGLEEKIETSTECRLWVFYIGGTECLALRIDNETHYMPLRTRTWHELKSYGQDNWIPQCYADGVFGSSVDGRTIRWGDGFTDFGGELERRFRAGFWGTIGFLVRNLVLRCNVGQTPYLTGDFTDPEVEMRISLDNGQTWGDWRPKGMGVQGRYETSVAWRGLGMLRRWKGFLAEFRVTAPVDFRVSDVLINENYGGR
jgi:hypothetical protein